MPSYACGDRSMGGLVRALGGPPALSRAQRPIFAHQKIEMRALFVCEFQEDLLALGVLEPLSVPLEELMRPAFAFDADQQRLCVVGDMRQPLGAGVEETARRSLE